MFAHDILPVPAKSSGEPMDSLRENADLSAARPAEANTGQASTSIQEIEHLSALGDDSDSEMDNIWSAFLLAHDNIQQPSPANSTGEPVDSLHESDDQDQELLEKLFKSQPNYTEIILNSNEDDFHTEVSAACDSNRVIADLVYRRTVTNGAVSEEWLRHQDICSEARNFLDEDIEDGSTEYYVTRVDKDVEQITESQTQHHILGKL
ncbi:hypothetical protein BsWGS_02693 [Bradybaena similaris]